MLFLVAVRMVMMFVLFFLVTVRMIMVVVLLFVPVGMIVIFLVAVRIMPMVGCDNEANRMSETSLERNLNA